MKNLSNALLVSLMMFAAQKSAKASTCSANDMNCFTAAAQNCTPATVEWSYTVGLFNNFRSILTLNGLDATGNCSFTDRKTNTVLTWAPQAEELMRSNGVNDQTIKQELIDANDAVKKSIGEVISCSIGTSSLVQTLHNWSGGSFSTNDFSSGTCFLTTPDGTKTPLVTNGRVPLTPKFPQSSIKSPPNAPAISNVQPSPVKSTPVAPSEIIVQASNKLPAGNWSPYILQANQDSNMYGLRFQVGSISTGQVDVTVTDLSTNQIQTVSLVLGTSQIVLGREMRVTRISSSSRSVAWLFFK